MVVVTGSSGFLGRHLVRRLRALGEKPFEVSRENGFDVRDFGTLRTIPPFDVLVHLAGKSYVPDSYAESLAYYETNLMGTANCLELCKRNNAKIIFPSTYVYGTPRYLPIDESHPVQLWNPYATSKIIGEQLCEAYVRDFGITACILRIFNMYGPGQDSRFLIPTIIDGVKSGKLCLKDLRPRRDFVHVQDVVAAVERCISHDVADVSTFNVGSGASYSVGQIVDFVQAISGKKVELQCSGEERSAEIFEIVADTKKIANELSWAPKLAFPAGLEALL